MTGSRKGSLISPQRTCIGCRAIDHPNNLVRIVCENRIGEKIPYAVFDVKRNKPGRGAWIHSSSECLAKALKKGSFNRAFRTRVQPHELVITA
ncbi:YlxR family protein [uncultured Rothia sp.]|uniref:YlxR family protein n=1 Tax=uncultured Rothia sp. TaxID=316088 RepID=UPI003217AFB5